ncbi:hypothetical protein WR30_33075 [Burkholderia contaminans FFH2055]|uniref:WD40/YVTN/BNR-like repeat-containing protein n=1 Tax=Burkholderia contaminans TaxID=488447 RepID=UPI000625003C|nr:sialidase family protein [Burkholderia contaminans]KKL31522.1 hypothetical protein WR30_33075 [Burkholderia contaminans FFH2055]MEB4629263.1 sialidase family protein [Burkholderia contaminans]MEB4635445.1 sialidase family protein [Burkholderia contaminans]MEB4651333.1 sialidase family protein [Burkholderia contaminans]MEB4661776.1 sialidase family protein [Burkholderia contaminans]
MQCAKWIKTTLAAALFAFGGAASVADAANSGADNPVHKLEIGRLTIFQKYSEYLRFVLADDRQIAVTDTAGFYWPLVSADTQGRFYIGNRVIDSANGRVVKTDADRRAIVLGAHYTVSADDVRHSVKVRRGGHECEVNVRKLGLDPADGSASEFLRGVVRFVDADGPLVGLVTLGGNQAGDTRYLAVSISPETCAVKSTDLGNPDYLFELGWTPNGHWWITGTTEGTLIRSDDGITWATTQLPDTISQVVSAYVADPNHVWLAANYAHMADKDNPEIVYSEDGGKTWTPLTWQSGLKSRIPPYWLEGQMRSRSKPVMNESKTR